MLETSITTILLVIPISALIFIPYLWTRAFPVAIVFLIFGVLSMSFIANDDMVRKAVWSISVRAGLLSSLYYFVVGFVAASRVNAPMDGTGLIILSFIIIPTLFVTANFIAGSLMAFRD